MWVNQYPVTVRSELTGRRKTHPPLPVYVFTVARFSERSPGQGKEAGGVTD